MGDKIREPVRTPSPDTSRVRIRSEVAADAPDIARITNDAFDPMPFKSGTEARIVEALRTAGALAVSLVAEMTDGELVGHIAFSPVTIEGRLSGWFGLGPVSVAPPLQRQGIGSALIVEGLGRLAELQADGCVLLGSPDYYGRFGFRSDPRLTYGDRPNSHLQRLVLNGAPPAGNVRFHPAFDTQ